jgi:dihydrofolate synthase / folylpolyglutamate synthase
MNFTEAEKYLLSICNITRKEFMKDPKQFGVYLERTKFFLKLLNNPQDKIPHYIHIAGTSGKGSVATFAESILRADGKKTGLLTSPHACSILERWQVNGKKMSKNEFTKIIEDIKPKLDIYIRTSPYDMVSYHELTDIIGFYYFAKKKVDWAVLEVGLGGRSCSSNVIGHKDVAVITNIGWDHQELIGPTKKEIAFTKAGIITTNCPVFTMEKSKRIRDIFETEAKKVGAVLNFISPNKGEIKKSDLSGTTYSYSGKNYQLSTPGKHQVNNAILVTRLFNALGFGDQAIKNGLKTAKQILRLETVSFKPTIILDGAHNQDKIASTVDTIGPKIPIHLVVGFSKNKNVVNMVKQLSTLNLKSIVCTRSTVNLFRQVADPTHISNLFKKQKIKVKNKIFLDPAEAFAWSRKQCKKDDILLVTGSIFLGGEIRTMLTKTA